MNSDWRLRRAARTDAALIAAIFASSRRAAMPYLPVLHAESEVLQWIKDVVLRNSLVTLAVSGDRQAGGFASVRNGVLEHLYVSPQLQGRGLGTFCSRRRNKRAPGDCDCMCSNETSRRVGSTSGVNLSWLNCAMARQMRKASLTPCTSGWALAWPLERTYESLDAKTVRLRRSRANCLARR